MQTATGRGRRALPATAPRALLAWAAAVLGVIGLIGPSWGPMLVPARATFHLGLLAAGSVLLVFGAARTVGALLSSGLSDRAARSRLAAAYGGLLVLGLVVIALAPGWGTVEIGAAALGFAFGAVTTEANAVAVLAGGMAGAAAEDQGGRGGAPGGRSAGDGGRAGAFGGGSGADDRDSGPEGGRRGARGTGGGAGGGGALSLVNAVYSAASAVSPVVVGLLLQWRLGWRDAFALWALLAVPAFWGLARAAGGLQAPAAPRTPADGRAAATLEPRVLALAVMSFIYTGIGWTVSGWAVTYLVGRFGVALLTGTLGPSVYYGCLAVGRVVNGRMVRRLSPALLLRAGSACAAAALLVLALAPGVAVTLVAFAVSGFCLAGIYPNLIGQAMLVHPERPGAMAGVVATGGAAGAAVVPFAAAALGRAVGLGGMAWLLGGLGVGEAVLALLALNRREGAPGLARGTPTGVG